RDLLPDRRNLEAYQRQGLRLLRAADPRGGGGADPALGFLPERHARYLCALRLLQAAVADRGGAGAAGEIPGPGVVVSKFVWSPISMGWRTSKLKRRQIQ